MSIVVGLTGPTGSGKSTASKTAEALGFKVIDCDKLARVAVEKGREGLTALVAVFGDDILNEDGFLNRKRLAQKAFSTKENTELLNKTLLPCIAKLIDVEIKSDKVLLDAPTLFESGVDKDCDFTIAVLADSDIRLKRIIARDNIDEAAAKLRMSAGKTDDFYIEKADHILYNNGEIDELKKAFRLILNNGGK